MTIRTWIFSACLLGAGLAATGAAARVNVNVNIGVPVAPLVVPAPPELVLIPGTPVYFSPEVDVDLFFTAGYWWRCREGRWLRARGYGGPWAVVGPRYVPRDVFRVPRNYRTVYRHERRIPYGQWKKHWREEQWHDDGRHGYADGPGRGYSEERRGGGHGRDGGGERGRQRD